MILLPAIAAYFLARELINFYFCCLPTKSEKENQGNSLFYKHFVPNGTTPSTGVSRESARVVRESNRIVRATTVVVRESTVVVRESVGVVGEQSRRAGSLLHRTREPPQLTCWHRHCAG